ncbi:GNAT family N-acetyltransferase [bacterium]|nr:GNAT family N-acetyltransferase [bacterium]
MNNRVEVKIAESSKELQAVFDIRRTVFVEEQNVDESEEYDDFEDTSTHLIAYLENNAVGAARFRRTANGAKLERFAVLKEARGKGVGAELVKECLLQTKDWDNIYLHAQIQVVDFYSKLGFEKKGEEFVEANIRHFKMIYNP